MKAFTRPIKRAVTVRSTDEALPDADWVIVADGAGVSVRRAGSKKATARKISWRTIIGTALIFQR